MTDLHEIDYSKLEERVLASMVQRLPDIEEFDWQRDLLELISNPVSEKPIVIIDDFHLSIDNDLYPRDITEFDIPWAETTITGRINGLLADEFFEVFHGIKDVKPEQSAEIKPDNRKQRRIDAAKERRKPRGQRKKLIMDTGSYDPNRTKDWLR